MVNSYLTFWVEQGWLKSFSILVMFTVFWVWTQPRRLDLRVLGLRAGILGFLVAGIFSTTMEDWQLWLLPVACALTLAIFSISQKTRIARTSLYTVATLILGGFCTLWVIGFYNSSKDMLVREFGAASGTQSVIALGPRNPKARSLGVKVDESIMGDSPAKLLREMAIAADVRILLGTHSDDAQRLFYMGHHVHGCTSHSGKRLILLAPEKIEGNDITALTQRVEIVEVLLPEIDEDGRVSFWDSLIEGELAAVLSKTSLVGVGNRVDWAWPEVIEAVKNSK